MVYKREINASYYYYTYYYYYIYWVFILFYGGWDGGTLGRIGTQFQKSSTEIDYRESSVFCVPMRPSVPLNNS